MVLNITCLLILEELLELIIYVWLLELLLIHDYKDILLCMQTKSCDKMKCDTQC